GAWFDERVQQHRHQTKPPAEDDGSFVASFGDEIVLRPLNKFPTPKNAPVKGRPRAGDQQRANQAPIGQCVQIIIVRLVRPHLQVRILRSILLESVLEVRRPGSKPEIVLPYLNGGG